MSVEHLAVVLHHSRAKGTAKLVLLGIANHQGDGGAWPSIRTLASYANVTERQVQKAIAQLVGWGELERDVQGGGTPATEDHDRPNLYHVRVTCPPWCDRTPNHRDTRKLAGRQRVLWTNPVSSATPGVLHDRGGVSSTTPGGVSSTTPKPSPEPATPAVVRQPQDARANTPPCAECSAPTQLACERRQAKLTPADRHYYVAARRHE